MLSARAKLIPRLAQGERQEYVVQHGIRKITRVRRFDPATLGKNRGSIRSGEPARQCYLVPERVASGIERRGGKSTRSIQENGSTTDNDNNCIRSNHRNDRQPAGFRAQSAKVRSMISVLLSTPTLRFNHRGGAARAGTGIIGAASAIATCIVAAHQVYRRPISPLKPSCETLFGSTAN